MSVCVLAADGGMRITRLTETASHPLDHLVEGVRTRSNEAFTAVYQATVNDLVSFAFGMLGDRRTAEDVVQQTFLELVDAASRFRGDGSSLRAWLYKSVRFGCLDEYRRRSRRPEVPHEMIPEVSVEVDPLEGHLDAELDAALSALNVRQRTALLLRHVAGLDGGEVSQVMGITRRAAYALIERAEAALRETLEGSR
jgi:RNA polymerase sigma-70 factor (ECF subfamily)